jgi:hypothetical protein
MACSVSNDAEWVTIGVKVNGEVSPDYQYRIHLDHGSPDGIADTLIKYKDGNSTGLDSLTVASPGQGWLYFKFDANEISVPVGDVFHWYAESQSGIPGSGSEGKPDKMPDVGFFQYTLGP